MMPGEAREFPLQVLSQGQLASAVLHLPAGPGPHPVVLCLHGLAGVKAFYTTLGRRLSGAGVACLRLDFRGCGDSAGSLEDLTLESQLADAEAAIRALRGRPDIRYDGVGLLGFSMGGAVAALLARRLGIYALGLWAPLSKLSKYTDSIPANFTPLGDGRVLLWEGHVVGAGLFESAQRHDPWPEIIAFEGPLFVAHGRQDLSIPFALSQDLAQQREAAGRRTQVLWLDQSGHLFEPPSERAKLYEVTTAFFTTQLGV